MGILQLKHLASMGPRSGALPYAASVSVALPGYRQCADDSSIVKLWMKSALSFGSEGSTERQEEKMSAFGEDLIQAMGEALSYAKGEGSAILHDSVDSREVRMRAKITQPQMPSLKEQGNETP